MSGKLCLYALFGVASIACIASGAATAALNGLGPASWAVNALAWAAGAALALVLARVWTARTAPLVTLALCAGGLCSTLAFPDQHGVHRWLQIGPLHVNAAALLLPAGVVALARVGITSPAGALFAVATAILLVVQPDASQASAFAVALAILIARCPSSPVPKLAGAAVAALSAALAWLRDDPLEPIIEVEGILALAAQTSPALAAILALALSGASVSPLAARKDPRARDPALALAAYLSVAALMPLFGAYPVPLAGLGMSFPMGFWLGIGCLAAISSARPIPNGRQSR